MKWRDVNIDYVHEDDNGNPWAGHVIRYRDLTCVRCGISQVELMANDLGTCLDAYMHRFKQVDSVTLVCSFLGVAYA